MGILWGKIKIFSIFWLGAGRGSHGMRESCPWSGVSHSSINWMREGKSHWSGGRIQKKPWFLLLELKATRNKIGALKHLIFNCFLHSLCCGWGFFRFCFSDLRYKWNNWNVLDFWNLENARVKFFSYANCSHIFHTINISAFGCSLFDSGCLPTVPLDLVPHFPCENSHTEIPAAPLHPATAGKMLRNAQG